MAIDDATRRKQDLLRRVNDTFLHPPPPLAPVELLDDHADPKAGHLEVIYSRATCLAMAVATLPDGAHSMDLILAATYLEIGRPYPCDCDTGGPDDDLDDTDEEPDL